MGKVPSRDPAGRNGTENLRSPLPAAISRCRSTGNTRTDAVAGARDLAHAQFCTRSRFLSRPS